MQKNTNIPSKKTLALFARLANIERLGELRAWEKLQLVEETREAGFSWVSIKPSLRVVRGHQSPWWDLHQDGRRRFAHQGHPNLSESWGIGGDVPFEWQALLEVHDLYSPLVNALLDGKEIDGAALRRFEPTLARFETQTGRLQYRLFSESPAFALLSAFGQVLRHEAFPFRRCPVADCKRIFVAGKNQKYCSHPCLAKGTATARKEERREYMREYMAARRKTAKRRAKKRTRAL